MSNDNRGTHHRRDDQDEGAMHPKGRRGEPQQQTSNREEEREGNGDDNRMRENGGRTSGTGQGQSRKKK